MCASSRRRLFPAIAVAVVALWCVGFAPLVAQSPAPTGDDLLYGTWTLNVSKSRFSPGPPPKSQRRTYEAHPDGMKVTIRIIEANGHSSTIQFIATSDSVEYPVTGSPDYDMISLRRVDAHRAEATLSHAGKVFGKALRSISEDGQTMTIRFEQGESSQPRVSYVAVYEKEGP
jgi:hypothetical protein